MASTIAARVKPKSEFNLEYDIGLVPGNVGDTVASANCTKMNAMMEAMYEGGAFKLANGGPTCPILKTIMGDGREYLIKGQMKGHRRTGGLISGPGGTSYPLPSVNYQNGVLGGNMLRFTLVDGEGNTSLYRQRGCGPDWHNVFFRGRPDFLGTPTGTQPLALIEVEGNDSNNPDSQYASTPTGRATYHGCVGDQAPIGIRTLKGYYNDANEFVEFENHADHGTVEDCWFWTPTVFKSENQQAVNWYFRNLYHEGTGGVGTVFDIERGGKITCDGLYANTAQIKLLRLKDFSQNTNEIDISGVNWDGFSSATDYFCVFEYYGYDDLYLGHPSYYYFPWSIRITGHHARQPATQPWDYSKAFMGPVGFDRSEWKWDNFFCAITNLPHEELDMVNVGAGFYQPFYGS